MEEHRAFEKLLKHYATFLVTIKGGKGVEFSVKKCRKETLKLLQFYCQEIYCLSRKDTDHKIHWYNIKSGPP